MMIARRLLLIGTLVTGFSFAACGSNSPGAPDYCGSPDPCGCTEFNPAQTCVARGTSCICSANTDSGADDAGPNDSGNSADAPAAADLADFIGRWSPIGGNGQANCGGQITSLPPNPEAVLTFVQDSPNTLTATSSDAFGCTLTLLVSGQTATLAQSSESCPVPTGGSVDFNTFTLVFTPAAGLPDAGPALDGGDPGLDGGDAGLDSGDAGSGDASSADDADAEGATSGGDAALDGASEDAAPGEDGAPSGGDADAGGAMSSGDAGVDAPSPGDDAGPAGTLDWQLADTDGTCVTTLHYTLARTP